MRRSDEELMLSYRDIDMAIVRRLADENAMNMTRLASLSASGLTEFAILKIVGELAQCRKVRAGIQFSVMSFQFAENCKLITEN